jgi:exportin-7
MEAIILLCSVRRSLFPTDKDRGAFLGRVMTGIRSLLLNQTGFQHQDNYHQFCRLLGRLKANYQLSELVKAEGYLEWLELASNFTVQSIRNWQYCTNSIHYLLALWGRLVAAVPYVRPDTGVQGHAEALEKQVLTVVDAYIESMLGSVEMVISSDGGLDDPLDDDGSLKEQLDRLPVICRFKYAEVAQFILNKFDPLLNQYRQALGHIGTASTENAPAEISRQICIIEGQLTWLTYIVGTIVGGHSWSSAHLGDGDEAIDASLSRQALQLAQCVDYRLTSSNGVGRADPKLEQALLYYFQNFRRVYMFMWDQVCVGARECASFAFSVYWNRQFCPIMPNHISNFYFWYVALIMMQVANPGSVVNSVSVVGLMAAKLDSGPSTKQKVYERMFEQLGMGDHTTVANLVVTKVGNNLKYWPDETEIIQKTLDLLLDMAGGYSSSKLLLSLDTVKFLARHHTEDHFPFLAQPANVRYRTTFHATLARLLLSPTGSDKLGLTFEQFVEPIMNNLNMLGNLSATDLRNEAARRPLIGVFRDLRGIASSLHNRKSYSMLFEMMYPAHLPLMAKVAEAWHDQVDVIVSLLRFLQEFCHNKANRVNFDQSSPNGILLFRSTSDVVCAFGRRLLVAPIPDGDIYKNRYKAMSLSLSVLTSTLSGNYVCFGVFALYNDPCLDNALDVALQMILSTPVEEVLAYPKFSKSYFAFISIFFRHHIKSVLALDTNILMQLMNSVHEGLQASDPQLSSLCASAIDHLATFYYENLNKDKIEMHNLRKVSYFLRYIFLKDFL